MSDKIVIYTDGACIPNPGRAAWCAILTYNGHEKELSGVVDGRSTNNVAELTAVLKALEAVKPEYSGEIEIITDSQYVINILTGDWNAKANFELIAAIEQHPKFRQVRWTWVRGHNGNRYNERADVTANRLALQAAGQHETPEAVARFQGMMQNRRR